MKIDMHCHVSGSGTRLDQVDQDVYFNPADNNHWFTRILYKLIESNLASMGGDPGGDGTISTDDYLGLIYTLLATSEELDGLVLLALDALYSPETGALDERRTDLWVSNRFLANTVDELNRRLQAEPDAARRAKRFFFAASVSPNRPDWRDELDFVVGET